MKFIDFIQREAVLVPLAARDRDGAIHELVEALGRSGGIDAAAVEEIFAMLVERERSGTTGFGRGVAVPHCKCPRVGRMVCAVGLSAAGMEFKALDGRPVHAVFVLLSPKGENDGHLAAMETVFRSLDQEAFRRSVRGARTPAEVLAILDQADATPRQTVGLGRGR